jgi:hypothetical protein
MASSSEKSHHLYFRLELIWWLITLILAVLLLFPILSKIPDYPFWPVNLVFIVVFVSFTRYIFLLRYTFLPPYQRLKIAIALMCIPLIFILVQEINRFQTFLDEQGYEALVGGMPRAEQLPMVEYIRSEMLLFGVGSVIASVLLAVRLIISVWRRHNGYEK